jgi:hypothetical protein
MNIVKKSWIDTLILRFLESNEINIKFNESKTKKRGCFGSHFNLMFQLYEEIQIIEF